MPKQLSQHASGSNHAAAAKLQQPISKLQQTSTCCCQAAPANAKLKQLLNCLIISSQAEAPAK
jgi:hypothetical protein